ncbi:MAG TPA: F0F1 ATP synthase subunit gamma [Candidatus Saccharimonadales bacterium]|nr:F0F1 ATP synthase subunit gamma [Candidatus Saccharimonadales bacterium]
MRRANVIQKETEQITTVKDLTGVFESIASTQIAKTKDKALTSEEFFQLLWGVYSSIRIDPKSQIRSRGQKGNGKKVFVIISAEAGLSGDIDQRLIETMLQHYDQATTDIIVLGSHGATQLKQRGIPYIHYFRVPESDSYIDVAPVIRAIASYSGITVYYEEYVSLGVQEIKSIDLFMSIQTMSEQLDQNEDIITSEDTIFEPSLDEIADQMEVMMMTLAFSQAILDSSLAQNASRFNAMAVAKKRANELVALYKLEYHRSKRAEGDRGLREVMISIKKKKRRAGAPR